MPRLRRKGDAGKRLMTKTFNTMKKKVMPLYETRIRWVNLQRAFDDEDELYEFVIECLEQISANEERMWD